MKSIPWFQPETNEQEKQKILSVLDSNYLNEGQVTEEFEKQIAAFVGSQHAVAVTSGTAAISLSLMALGVGSGDEVIIPDLTFIATANAARMCGATVKLVDIDLNRLVLSTEAIEAALTSKTKAIVSVDVNGRGAPYEFLEEFCRKKGLFLVCDAAEALGSQYQGRYLGTFGEAGCFSFSTNKTLTTGQGGMIVTNNSKLHDRLRELKDQGRRYRGTGGNDLHPVLGFNFKLTNLQAAVGLAQFEKIADRLEKSRVRDQWYLEDLREIKGLSFPDMEMAGEVRQWTDILHDRAAEIEAELKKNNVGSRRFWYPLHTQGPYATEAVFSNSTIASRRGLWLPSYFGITRDEVKYVTELIARFLRK